jgi:hypothetical protein
MEMEDSRFGKILKGVKNIPLYQTGIRIGYSIQNNTCSEILNWQLYTSASLHFCHPSS